MQELLNYTTDLLHTFDSEERVALAVLDYLKTNKKALLEKEKEVIEDIIDIIDSENSGQSAEHRLDEIKTYLLTFNTKEK